MPIHTVYVCVEQKKCPFVINNQYHPQEIGPLLPREMEVVRIFLMEAVDQEAQDFSIQTQIRIRLILIRILMGVTVVLIAHIRRIIKVHIFQMAFEITPITVIVAMLASQYQLKLWPTLT